jgi:pimeloyl-ACP methyl ester carboxylesterase
MRVAMRRVAATFVAGLVLAAAAPAAAPPHYDRCGTKAERTRAIAFRAADGTRLVGLLLGKGTRGVVLAHQFRSNLCEWLPTARVLVKSGYRVLAFDFRDNGSGGAIDLDVSAAGRALTSRGVQKLYVAGGSMGGTAALVAAPKLAPQLAGVVSLSGPAHFQDLDAAAAVAALTVPVLYVASADDSPYVDDARALFAATPEADKQLEVVPGSAHGASILRGRSALLLRFLRAH